ncbi:hypothetical protein EVAR_33337_1 [Eumeta japonica]|uniref:Uncharacterized protein n=1 Tax=Eumeta variegata TaxID=151549 RepID=A0A4C1YN11_EUMVA|nr:hypothetical protein EVAR_33337_1 [Eumeta japonica]
MRERNGPDRRKDRNTDSRETDRYRNGVDIALIRDVIGFYGCKKLELNETTRSAFQRVLIKPSVADDVTDGVRTVVSSLRAATGQHGKLSGQAARYEIEVFL